MSYTLYYIGGFLNIANLHYSGFIDPTLNKKHHLGWVVFFGKSRSFL